MSAADNQGLLNALRKLEDVRQTGLNSWIALCPLHDDHRPSLHIDVKAGDEGPRPLFWCTSCGAVFEQVLAKIDIRPYTLYEGLAVHSGGKREKRYRPPKSLSDGQYEIVQFAHEQLLGDAERLRWLHEVRGLNLETVRRYRLGFHLSFQVPVYENQILINRRLYSPAFELGLGWRPKWSGMRKVSRALYPDPSGMCEQSWILFVEGELDCLIARQHGLPAWTQTGGAASSLLPRWEKYFRGRNIAVCYDCDDAGTAGALAAARQLVGWGCQVRIIDLGLDNREDVTDFFVKYGRTDDMLLQLIRCTPNFVEVPR